jgi:hypothetical protein
MKSFKGSLRNFSEVTGFDGSMANIVKSFFVCLALFLILGCAECVAEWIERL